MSEYPSERILKKIRNWDVSKDNPFELAELIYEVWNSDYGSASLIGKRVKTLRLATGGWLAMKILFVQFKGQCFQWFVGRCSKEADCISTKYQGGLNSKKWQI